MVSEIISVYDTEDEFKQVMGSSSSEDDGETTNSYGGSFIDDRPISQLTVSSDDLLDNAESQIQNDADSQI